MKTTIKLYYTSLHSAYECRNHASDIFDYIAELTDAKRFFSDEELSENKETFISDLMNGHKQHYIDFLNTQIQEIKPAGLHGVYDFELIREYEEIINKIENF